MNESDILEKARAFDSEGKHIKDIDQALGELSGFLQRFPLRKNPSKIDALAPEDIYNPGTADKNYFFYWLEYKLRALGRFGIVVLKSIDKLLSILRISRRF